MQSLLKTRRRFLHLSATGLLAPFFRQMHALAATQQAQRRVAFVFFPHGTPNTSGFWPGEGALASVSGVLGPLQAVKNRMLIVGGLGSGLEKGYGHQGGNTAALTGRGSNLKEDGFYIPYSPSADWLIARHLGQEPLVLGQKVSSGVRHLVSWSAPNRAGAVRPVNEPNEGFKRVFGRDPAAGTCTSEGGLQVPTEGGGAGASTNVLDVVAADLKALKASLPSWSRSTLDDQLDAISDLQVQAKAANTTPVAPQPVSSGGGTSEGCYSAGTDDFYLRSNYMADLIVASFQGGTRRVATFQQGTASGDSFSVPGFGGYHGEVHNLSNGTTGELGKVTRMQTELFKDIGYFVNRLATTKDMSGQSLLDSTLVYICTEFSPYGATSDPHNTGGGLVVNLIGASDTFATTGKAISVSKKSVGHVLSQAATYMGLATGRGLSESDLGRFEPLADVLKA